MSGVVWPLVELASTLLERREREAVLGDLLETDESALRGLFDIFGLVLRRQAAFWKNPRPWLAGFVVALPSSYLLMRVSLSVTYTYQRLVNHKVYASAPTGHEGFPLLLCHVVLLIAWSWSSGYIVGSVSRRTLWVSFVLSMFPCFSCLCLLSSDSPSSLCVFLFLLPAIFGVHHGLRNARISLPAASILALTMTALMISAWSNKALWILNWALICPAVYLVVAAWRSRQEGRTAEKRRSLCSP